MKKNEIKTIEQKDLLNAIQKAERRVKREKKEKEKQQNTNTA